MAKDRVLPSTARNYGASFISVMNLGRGDYAMCYLLRAARQTGATELRVDLLSGAAEPAEVVGPELAGSIAGYRAGFGAHVERSGSSPDLVAAADLRVRIAWGQVVGQPDPEHRLRARLHCEVTIVDDRGRAHVGRAEEVYACHPTRGYY